MENEKVIPTQCEDSSAPPILEGAGYKQMDKKIKPKQKKKVVKAGKKKAATKKK
jgi:hypothetical protein